MARFRIDHPAPPGGWPEVRPRLEEALAAELPFALEQRWEEESLHLRAPGAQATVRVVDGRLRADADLRPPASFFGSTIERELRRALQEAWPVDPPADPTESREG